MNPSSTPIVGIEALSDDHILIGEEDCFLELLDTKSMKVLKSKVFDEFRAIHNVEKTGRDNEIGVST